MSRCPLVEASKRKIHVNKTRRRNKKVSTTFEASYLQYRRDDYSVTKGSQWLERTACKRREIAIASSSSTTLFVWCVKPSSHWPLYRNGLHNAELALDPCMRDSFWPTKRPPVRIYLKKMDHVRMLLVKNLLSIRLEILARNAK